MKIPTFTTRDELNDWLRQIGQDPLALSMVSDALAEMIREVKSRQAEAINDDGINSQVDYLLVTDEEDVEGLWRDLRDAVGEDE